jgi:hypothetical protein
VEPRKASRPAAEVSANGPREIRSALAGKIDLLANKSLPENQDSARVAEERAMLRARWRSAWEHGARVGFEGERRQGGSYPQGFARWPLDQKNAWYSGFNRGFHDRLRLASEEA